MPYDRLTAFKSYVKHRYEFETKQRPAHVKRDAQFEQLQAQRQRWMAQIVEREPEFPAAYERWKAGT